MHYIRDQVVLNKFLRKNSIFFPIIITIIGKNVDIQLHYVTSVKVLSWSYRKKLALRPWQRWFILYVCYQVILTKFLCETQLPPFILKIRIKVYIYICNIYKNFYCDCGKERYQKQPWYGSFTIRMGDFKRTYTMFSLKKNWVYFSQFIWKLVKIIIHSIFTSVESFIVIAGREVKKAILTRSFTLRKSDLERFYSNFLGRTWVPPS